MTSKKSFSLDGETATREPYHYKACGLDDVYLLNGFTIEETAYGRGVSVHNMEALHQAIGLKVISDKKPLSAREFWFLRKQMNYTQEQLSKKLHVDTQTIARYEKDQTAIPGSADAMLRVIYAVDSIPADRRLEVLTEVIAELEERSAGSAGAMYFRQTSHGWDQGLH